MAEPLRILVVDDEPTRRALLRAALPGPDFAVEEATCGAEALAAMALATPDLVRQVRRDPLLKVVPIILLTGQDSGDVEIAGLEAGADDYVVKPLRPREFRSRVQAQIRRRERDLAADPFGHLPSGSAIRRELSRRIESGSEFAAIYADLDFFKPYVDRFGFVRAGEVIQETARLLFECVRREAGGDGFAGHIAGDDFLAVCASDRAADVCRRFIADFDRAAPDFYPDDFDDPNGFEGLDRAGQRRRFPRLSVSLCVVDSRRHALCTASDVSRLAFEARPAAKALAGSAFVEV